MKPKFLKAAVVAGQGCAAEPLSPSSRCCLLWHCTALLVLTGLCHNLHQQVTGLGHYLWSSCVSDSLCYLPSIILTQLFCCLALLLSPPLPLYLLSHCSQVALDFANTNCFCWPLILSAVHPESITGIEDSVSIELKAKFMQEELSSSFWF